MLHKQSSAAKHGNISRPFLHIRSIQRLEKLVSQPNSANTDTLTVYLVYPELVPSHPAHDGLREASASSILTRVRYTLQRYGI